MMIIPLLLFCIVAQGANVPPWATDDIPQMIQERPQNHKTTSNSPTVTVLVENTDPIHHKLTSRQGQRQHLIRCKQEEQEIQRLDREGRKILQSCGHLPPPPPEDLEFESEIAKLQGLLRGCAAHEANSLRWKQNLPPETIRKYLSYLRWQDDYLGRVMGKIQVKLACPKATQIQQRQPDYKGAQQTMGRKIIRRKYIVRKSGYQMRPTSYYGGGVTSMANGGMSQSMGSQSSQGLFTGSAKGGGSISESVRVGGGLISGSMNSGGQLGRGSLIESTRTSAQLGRGSFTESIRSGGQVRDGTITGSMTSGGQAGRTSFSESISSGGQIRRGSFGESMGSGGQISGIGSMGTGGGIGGSTFTYSVQRKGLSSSTLPL